MVISVTKHITNSNWYKKKYNQMPKGMWAYLFRTIAELYEQGFSLNQTMEFLKVLLPKYNAVFELVQESLLEGETIESSFRHFGITTEIQAQLFFGQTQGRFQVCLYRISKHLDKINKYKSECKKVLLYPILLLICLIVMLFGIRIYILPQILEFVSPELYSEKFILRVFIKLFVYMPQIFLSLFAFIGSIYLWFHRKINQLDPLEKYQKLCSIPIVKNWVRRYCSYKISREFGYCYEAGFSVQQIIQLWLDYPLDPFLSMIAEHLKIGFLRGETLPNQLLNLDVFLNELPLVIYQGEITSQLSEQCRIYSERIYHELMQDIQWKISFIQPILFIIIAVIILLLYLLMMLPMLTIEGL